MNKKFTLTLIIAIVLVSVIAFSACGLTAVAEDGISIWDDSKNGYGEYPYPKLETDKVSPGFSGYTEADQIMMKEGTELIPVNGKMSAWEMYQTIAANYSNIARMAQITTTASSIEVHVTTAGGLFGALANMDLSVQQYASWLSANDGQGSNYTQTISQMKQLGIPALDFLDIPSNFGAWTKSAYFADENANYSQTGDEGSLAFDATAPGGITATWKGTPEPTPPSTVSYEESMSHFDIYTRLFDNTDGKDDDYFENDYYRVYFDGNDELGAYDNDTKEDDKDYVPNKYNDDKDGHNKVILVEFMGTDGEWGNRTFYVWDDYTDEDGVSHVGEDFTAHYTTFDYDQYYRALPNRGDAVSNYLVNEKTIDKTGSKVTSTQVKDEDGQQHTLYILEVKLTDAVYPWKLITSGELGSLQGSIINFVQFDTGYYTFSKDLTLRYEVWDTGVIRRVIRQYSIETDPNSSQLASANQILILPGLADARAYGKATNNQIQEFAYGGSAVDLTSDSTSYAFTQGIMLGKWERVGLGVGLGAAVLIVLIVTLVVLAKKGVIGKKKKNKKAAEGPAEEVVEDNGTDSTENTENKE